jgi:hypothetical protein
MEEVELDPSDSSVLWLKYKMESNKRKIICKDNPQHLYTALKEGMERYRHEDALALQRGTINCVIEGAVEGVQIINFISILCYHRNL